MPTSTPLFQPTTAAQTVKFELRKEHLPARLSATGLQNAETVAVKTLEGEGSTETTAQPYKDGAPLALKQTDPVTNLTAVGWYQVEKPITAVASTLFLTKA